VVGYTRRASAGKFMHNALSLRLSPPTLNYLMFIGTILMHHQSVDINRKPTFPMKPFLLFIAMLSLLSGCAQDDHDGRYPESQPVPPAMTPTPPKPQSAAPRGAGPAFVAIGTSSRIGSLCLVGSAIRHSFAMNNFKQSA
jgi:hypothetical protein